MGNIIGIKQAALSEFNDNKYIRIGFNSKIMINPDIPEAHKLRQWELQRDETKEFYKISEFMDKKSNYHRTKSIN